MEPQGVLEVNGEVTVDVLSTFTFRGEAVTAAGEDAFLTIALRGTNTHYIETPISASVVGPDAGLVLGGANGQVFRGQYYADRVELRSGIQVVVEQPVVATGALRLASWGREAGLPGPHSLARLSGTEEAEQLDRVDLSTRREDFARGCSVVVSPPRLPSPLCLVALGMLGLFWARRRGAPREASYR